MCKWSCYIYLQQKLPPTQLATVIKITTMIANFGFAIKITKINKWSKMKNDNQNKQDPVRIRKTRIRK